MPRPKTGNEKSEKVVKEPRPENALSGSFYRNDKAHSQVPPVEELKKISPHSPPETGLTGPGGTKARKTKLAVMGLSAELLDKGNPRYAKIVRLANAFRKVRTREYFTAHGFVSAGVSALLANSAMCMAASRYIYEEVASDTYKPSERAELLQRAAKLSDSGRQHELAAWELAAREGQIKRRDEANRIASPWLVEPAVSTVKRLPGRPRKAQVVASEALHVKPASEVLDGLLGADEVNGQEGVGVQRQEGPSDSQ